MGVDERNHLFDPGLSTGWQHAQTELRGLGQEKLIVRDILLAEISATGVDPGDRHESWITNPAKSSTKKTRTQFGMPAPNNLCSFQSDQGVNPCVRGLLVPRAQASLVTHFF